MNHTAFAAELVSLVEREAIALGVQNRLEVRRNKWDGFDFSLGGGLGGGGRIARFTFDDTDVCVFVFADSRMVLESQATFTGFAPAVVAAALTAPLFA